MDNPYYPTGMAMPRSNYQWTQPSSPIQWVQGEAGAKAYSIAPGSTVLLMDSESSVFYIKSSDATGIPQPLRIFDYTERVQETAKEASNDYVTREEFNELKKMLDDLTK